MSVPTSENTTVTAALREARNALLDLRTSYDRELSGALIVNLPGSPKGDQRETRRPPAPRGSHPRPASGGDH